MAETNEYVQVGWAKPNKTGILPTVNPWFFIPLDDGEPMDDWKPIYMVGAGGTDG